MTLETKAAKRATDWEAIYRAEHDKLWRSVLLFCRDRSVASESVAEAFAQAMEAEARLRYPERWLWATAFRLASREMGRRARLTAHDEDQPYQVPALRIELQEALAALPEKQRASIVLHYYGGYGAKEIARLIGSTPGAVWVHLSKARRTLRTILEVGNAEST